MWLPEWYCVKAVSYNGSIAIVAYNSTLKGIASFEATSLEPVYNITVTPCNMAGCNESCDVHSVQTESEMSIEGRRLNRIQHCMHCSINLAISHIHGGIESPMIDGDIIFMQHTTKV